MFCKILFPWECSYFCVKLWFPAISFPHTSFLVWNWLHENFDMRTWIVLLSFVDKRQLGSDSSYVGSTARILVPRFLHQTHESEINLTLALRQRRTERNALPVTHTTHQICTAKNLRIKSTRINSFNRFPAFLRAIPIAPEVTPWRQPMADFFHFQAFRHKLPKIIG